MNIYFGIDLAQVIIAAIFLLIFIGFAIWGYRNLHQRISIVEEKMNNRDFRDIEMEPYEEQEQTKFESEGTRLEAEDRERRKQPV